MGFSRFAHLLLAVARYITFCAEHCDIVKYHKSGVWSFECRRNFHIQGEFKRASVVIDPKQWIDFLSEDTDYFLLEAKMTPFQSTIEDESNWTNVSFYTAVQFGRSYSTRWDPYRGAVTRRANFACFIPKGLKHAPPIGVSTAFASRQGDFAVSVRTRSKNSNVLFNAEQSLWIQGSRQTSRDWFQIFKLGDDTVANGHVNLQVHVNGSRKHRNMKLFLFPFDSSPCVKRYLPPGTRTIDGTFADYACFPVAELTLCVEHYESHSFHISVGSKATIPISTVSHPPLQAGRWMALLRNSKYIEGGVERVEMRLNVSDNRWPIWIVITILLVVPPFYLLVFGFVLLNTSAEAEALRNCLVVNSTAPLVHTPSMRLVRSERPFWAFAKRRFHENFVEGSYLSLSIISSSAFFMAALQLSLSGWYDSQWSGSRDFCRYNYECYHPWLIDMPVNNLISHIPYIVCGVVVLFLLLYVDYQMYRDVGTPVVNLHVFYALGVSEIWEGFGSMVYHVCPRTLGFQFDVAMMYVIAILSVLGLADGEVCSRDIVPAPVLFSLLVLPLWFACVVGTWYDVGALRSSHKWIYIAVVSIWGVCVVSKASVLFQRTGSQPSWRGLFILRCLVLSLILGALMKPGGLAFSTGKMLLFASIGGMLVMTGYQLWHQPRGLRCPFRLRLLHASFAFTSTAAFYFFLATPYRAGHSPWSSHDKNLPCVIFGTFDHHDVWHILSAVMLALWTFVLLEIRMGNLLFKPDRESIRTTIELNGIEMSTRPSEFNSVGF